MNLFPASPPHSGFPVNESPCGWCYPGVFPCYFFTGIFISKSDYEMRLRHHINEANWLSGSWLNWCNLKLDTAYLQKLLLKFVSFGKNIGTYSKENPSFGSHGHITQRSTMPYLALFLWACILAVFFSKQALRHAKQKLRLQSYWQNKIKID